MERWRDGERRREEGFNFRLGQKKDISTIILMGEKNLFRTKRGGGVEIL